MRFPSLAVLFSLVLTSGLALAASESEPVIAPPRPDQRAVPETDGFQSDYHKKHAGQIVFGKALIDRTHAPSSPVTNWNANDKIFLRVYLADSAENLQVSTGKKCSEDSYDRAITAFVNGGESMILYYQPIERNLWARDVTFSLVEGDDGRLMPLYDPAPMPTQNLEHSFRYNYLNELVPALKDGDNAVRFVVTYRCDLDNDSQFNAADANVTIRMTPAIRAAMSKGNASVIAKSVLPSTMDKFMKAAVSPYYSAKYTVAAASASGQWRIEYDAINGRPTLRKIDGQAFLREFDGKKCAWVNVTYEQQNVGGNRYGDKMVAYVPPGAPTTIQCSALPK